MTIIFDPDCWICTAQEDIVMTGGGGTTSTNTVTQQVPGYLQAAQQQAIGQGSNIASTPYQPYTGQTVAPFSPMQQQYFQGIEGNQGSWQAPLSASEGVSSNIAAGGYTPTVTPTQANVQNITPSNISQNMAQYYDPAISSELGGESAAINQQTQQAQANANRQLGSEGAYGYSGSALQDAQIAQNGQLAMGQYAAQLLPQAFNEAGTLSNQDIQNQLAGVNANNTANLQGNLQNYDYAQLGSQNELASGQLALSGAQQLGTSGLAGQQAGYTDINALGAAGQSQQNQSEAMLQYPYSQYQAAQAWPFQTLASEYSALGTVSPYAGTGQTSSSTSPTSSLGTALGTALAGTAAAGSILNDIKTGGRVKKAKGGMLRKSIKRDAGGIVPYSPEDTNAQQPYQIIIPNTSPTAAAQIAQAADPTQPTSMGADLANGISPTAIADQSQALNSAYGGTDPLYSSNGLPVDMNPTQLPPTQGTQSTPTPSLAPPESKTGLSGAINKVGGWFGHDPGLTGPKPLIDTTGLTGSALQYANMQNQIYQKTQQNTANNQLLQAGLGIMGTTGTKNPLVQIGQGASKGLTAAAQQTQGSGIGAEAQGRAIESSSTAGFQQAQVQALQDRYDKVAAALKAKGINIDNLSGALGPAGTNPNQSNGGT